MTSFRQRSYSEKQINKALDNPRILKKKAEITAMAEALKLAERPDDGTYADDDAEMQRPIAQPRAPRGPLVNQSQEKRVEAAAENVERILRSLNRGNPADQQHAQEHAEDDGDAEDLSFLDPLPEENDLPPPRPRPGIRRTIPDPTEKGEREIISNRDAARSPQYPGAQGKPEFHPQPSLSEMQTLRLQIEQQNKDIESLKAGKRLPVADPGTGKLRFARKPKIDMESAQKVDLLSEHLFYDFSPDDFTVRPVDIQAQFGITAAKQARDGAGDVLALVDVLQTLVNPAIDVQLLTRPDFYYLMYWLRFNSYPSIPFNIYWDSRYGHKIPYTLTKTNLTYKRAEPNLDDLMRWQEMGLDYPRMRDWLILEFFDLDPEDREIYRKAQWFKGDTPEEKVDRMYASSVDTLAQIDAFREACNHGVFDTVDLVDLYFEPAPWRETLLKAIATIHERAEEYKDSEPLMYVEIMATAEVYQTEADTIQAKLEKGERVEPDAERVSLRFSPLAFFPDL